MALNLLKRTAEFFHKPEKSGLDSKDNKNTSEDYICTRDNICANYIDEINSKCTNGHYRNCNIYQFSSLGN